MLDLGGPSFIVPAPCSVPWTVKSIHPTPSPAQLVIELVLATDMKQARPGLGWEGLSHPLSAGTVSRHATPPPPSPSQSRTQSVPWVVRFTSKPPALILCFNCFN